MDLSDFRIEEIPRSIIQYSANQIKTMTKNFKHNIGAGGSSAVYKGYIQKNTAVAVKKINLTNLRKVIKEERIVQWQMELMFLSKCTHDNILKVIGYCKEESQLSLVTEYMQNGNLATLIAGPTGWRQRVIILQGVAQGLQHAHSKRIIVRDLKPHNILIDNKFSPRVADFGAATDGVKDHWKGMPFGTSGYMDPEYKKNSHEEEAALWEPRSSIVGLTAGQHETGSNAYKLYFLKYSCMQVF